MNIELPILALFSILTIIPNSFSQNETLVGGLSEELEKSKEMKDKAKLLIYTNSEWTAEIHDGNYVKYDITGIGNDVFFIPCGQTNVISASVIIDSGDPLDAYLIKEGKVLANSENSSNFQVNTIDCSGIGKFQELPTKSTIGGDYLYPVIGVIGVLSVMIFLMYKGKLRKNFNKNDFS